MEAVTEPPHRSAAKSLREHLAVYEAKRDLVSLGAYKRGADPRLDAALERIEEVEAFLRQDRTERTPFEQTVERMTALTR